MSQAETPDHAAPAGRFARFWPLLWAVWLPILIQPITALFNAHPAPTSLIGTLAGVVLFVAIYVWAAWHNDVSRPLFAARAPEALWLPIVALTAVSIVLNLNDHKSGWLTLFIYTSAIAGARRPRIEAAVAVAALTFLTVALGVLTGVAMPGLGQTVFLVAVVGAMVIGLGWTSKTSRASHAAVAHQENAMAQG